MNELTHLSLFSGIGGLDLAAEWAGFKTVGQCEWADYPTKVLEKHWPDVPRWRDIRTLTGESFYEQTGLRTVDVISGGFPCQPFSVAGKRRGKEDDRYLWPEMVRVIKELRPAWIVGENVAGIVKMALPDILSELESCGYRTRAFLVPACAVGARHRRYRVAIVAYTESQHEGRLPVGEKKKKPGFTGSGKDVADTQSERKRGLPIQQGRPQQENTDTERGCEDVQHSDSPGCKEQHSSGKPDGSGLPCRRCDAGAVCNTSGTGLPDGTGRQMGKSEPEPEPERPGCNVSDTDMQKALWREPCEGTSGETAGSRENIRNGKEEYAERQRRPAQPGLGGVAARLSDRMDGDLDFIIDHYWDVEPDIPRVAAGVPDRVGRLKALGNAVVPQQFYPFFEAIAEIMEETKWT